LEGCTAATCRRYDAADLRRQVAAVSPHWIVHCGPLARGSWDLPADSLQAEGEEALSAALAEIADRVAAALTVISTDAVFAGPRMFHDEQSSAASPAPVAVAARRVEAILAGRPRVLVVRTHAYGWSPRTEEPAFAERLWQHLAEGTPCRLDPHSHATPILATDLAELLWLAYRRGIEGLCHVAGAERTSAYRFAVELAACFGLPIGPGVTADEKDGEESGGVLRETSLSTRRARRELERPMPTLREGLERFARQAKNGFRARLRGGAPGSGRLRHDAA
jgi:dTDP-4-dehydrorhamnose reductase